MLGGVEIVIGAGVGAPANVVAISGDFEEVAFGKVASELQSPSGFKHHAQLVQLAALGLADTH